MEDEEHDPQGGKAAAADDTQMRVGEFVCPMAFVNVFTPMEFEEVSRPRSFFASFLSASLRERIGFVHGNILCAAVYFVAATPSSR